MTAKKKILQFVSDLDGLELRTVEERDMTFLRNLYGSIREEELKMTNWNENQKAVFIDQQFTAQHQYYTENYQGAHFKLIRIHNLPAGRLYLVEWDEEIRIIDIALLPEYRGLGWGSKILKGIIEKGRQERKIIGIHVESFNPAMRLYRRLGFRNSENKGVYQYMVWSSAEN